MNKKREGFTLPHFKTYCKAIVIKIIWYSAIKKANILKTHHTKCWGGCGAFRILISYPKDCEMIQPWWKPVGQLLKKLNIHVPVIPPLGISQREKITPVHTKMST